MELEIKLVERFCINPKCKKPFRVSENDKVSLYHSIYCKNAHEGKNFDWNEIVTEINSLPKEVKDWITSTPIPKVY